MLPDAARRFDRFECCIAARLGLGEAARYATTVGLDRVARLVGERSRAVSTSSASSTASPWSGRPRAAASCRSCTNRLEPHGDPRPLAEHGINAWVNSPFGAPLDGVTGTRRASVRLSPHYVTDDDDLDRLARALHSIA